MIEYDYSLIWEVKLNMSKMSSRNNDFLNSYKNKTSEKIYSLLLKLINEDTSNGRYERCRKWEAVFLGPFDVRSIWAM